MANETLLTIVGNLTADPELAYSPNGVARCRFTVASSARVFDKTRNEWVDGQPMFLGCTAWRTLAEHAAETLAKGMRVIVVGRLRQHHWTTETGERRSAFGLEVDEIGPSLRFVTAKVARADRTTAGAGRPPADDPFSIPARPGVAADPPF